MLQDGEAFLTGDRRKSPRARSVILIGRIDRAKRDDICLVRDISPTGAQLRTNADLRLNDRLALEIGGSLQVSGVVRWTHENLAGIAFDREVLIDEAFTPIRLGRVRRAHPRFRRRSEVCLSTDGLEVQGELLNISPGGVALKISGKSLFGPGKCVAAEVAGLPPAAARVQWTDGARMGLTYNQPLRLWDLQQWLEGAAPPILTNIHDDFVMADKPACPELFLRMSELV